MRDIQVQISPELKARLQSGWALVSPWVDRRVLLGALLGGGVIMTTYAVAVDGTQNFVATSSEQINQAQSVQAEQIKAGTQDCAAGKPGTVGGAINAAVKAHTEMAAIPVDVEQLFNVSENCWAGASQILDLSFAIPSLASITSAAQSALLKYAQKKVCSAADKLTGLVTSPINKGLEKIGNIDDFKDINGMTNDGVGGLLGQIDPDLGKEYRSAPGSTYTVDTTTFTPAQSTFSGATTTPTSPTKVTPKSPFSGSAREAQPSLMDRMGNLF